MREFLDAGPVLLQPLFQSPTTLTGLLLEKGGPHFRPDPGDINLPADIRASVKAEDYDLMIV